MLNYILLILCVLLGTAVAVLAVRLRGKTIDEEVLLHSEKLFEIMKLNDELRFEKLETELAVSKQYDNKTNFNRIEPAYLMTAELRNRIDHYSEYIAALRRNRKLKVQYDERLTNIMNRADSIDFESLRIPERIFRAHEKRLSDRLTARSYSECTFSVSMTYSSPKGKVKSEKHGKYNFDELFASFESISRTQLDRETFKKLALVERGLVSDSMRYDIMKRDGFKCAICGASAKEGARLHVDHIVPIAKNGKSVPENLRTLCERCNIGKSDKSEDDSTLQNLEAEVCEVSESDKSSTPKPTSDSKKGENRCPLCNGELVLRNGPHGEFIGCSNFPKCRFSKRKQS